MKSVKKQTVSMKNSVSISLWDYCVEFFKDLKTFEAKFVKQNPNIYYILNTLPPSNQAAYVIIMKTTTHPIRAIDNVRYPGAIKKIRFVSD